jgi:hypothetical protein
MHSEVKHPWVPLSFEPDYPDNRRSSIHFESSTKVVAEVNGGLLANSKPER